MEALDQIVTAVGDIILVFEEAQTKWGTEIFIEGNSLNRLVGEINDMISDKAVTASRIDNAALAQTLTDCNAKLEQSTRNLREVAAQSPGGIIQRKDYAKLHHEMKVIMHTMIQQLRISDDVNVESLKILCKRVFDCFVRMRNCDSVGGLEGVAGETNKQLEDLQVHVRGRVAETTAMDLRERMQKALDTVVSKCPAVVEACDAEIKGTGSKAAKEAVLTTVLLAIKELLDVIDLTSAKIHEYELLFPMPEYSAKRPRDGAPQVQQELARLTEAVRRRDEGEATDAAREFASEALRQIAQAGLVMDKASTQTLKSALKDNMDALNRAIPEVVRATKVVLASPDDAGAQKAFDKAVNDASHANRRLEELQKPEHFPVQNARAVEAAIADLHRAVESGDSVAAAEAARLAAQRMMDQVAAGRSAAADMKDPKLKNYVLDACDKLEALVPEMVRATKAALENPNDARAQELLRDVTNKARVENAKIAEGVVEDQLQRNRDALEKHLGEVYAAAAAGDKDGTQKAVDHAQDDMKRRIELGRELARQVRDPALKRQILDACDELDALLPELGTRAKVAAANPGDATKLSALGGTIDQIKAQADRVTGQRKFPLVAASADPNRVPEQTLATGGALDAAIDRLWEAVKAGDRAAAEAALGEVLGHMTRQANHARMLADQTKDPATREMLLKAADQMERLIPQVATAARDAIDNPHDPVKEQKLRDLLDETKTTNQQIMNGARAVKKENESPERIMEMARENAELLSDAMLRLKQALAAGDRVAAAKYLKEVMDRIRQQIKLGRQLAGMTDDPELKAVINNAVNNLERLAPQVEEAVLDAMANPNDQAKQKRVADLLDEVDVHSRTIAAAADQIAGVRKARANPGQVHEMARVNQSSLEDAIARLKKAVDANDRVAAAAALRDVMARIREQIGYGKEIASMTNDPALKKKALDAVATLERLAPEIEAATKDALDHPNDPAKKKHLHDVLDQAAKAGRDIAEVGAEVHRRATAPPKPKPAPVVVAPRERPSAYTADGKRDEVMAAAHSVGDALDAARAPRTAAQRSLNEIAAQIAIEMEKLSLAARESNKRDMIGAAKRIAALIEKVQYFSEQVASKCSHPVLADELRSVSTVPQNFAVQLKIVTAVKEAVQGNASAAAQLVVCAKGLANSVITTVHSAESAALRCPKEL